MKLTVTRSGLKDYVYNPGNYEFLFVRAISVDIAVLLISINITMLMIFEAETKQQGITEYWSHRITYCLAPSNLPRVFCWVYKHEGKRMKPELRCHAALCRKTSDPYRIAQTLEHYLRAALQEYRREKLCRQNARLNALTIGQPLTGPKRKLLLQTGSLNFRPPVGRSKSAPRLFAIDEENEYLEEQSEEYSDTDSLCYRESPISGDSCSTNSLESSEIAEISISRQNSFRGNDDNDDDGDGDGDDDNGKEKIMRSIYDECSKQDEQQNGSVASDFSSSLESGPSSVSSDDGVQTADFENRSWKIRRLPSSEKQLARRETDSISEESGYDDHDDGNNGAIAIIDDDDSDDNQNNEVHYDDDESQYDEQVTAL
uniref:PID domain-containing protein n=1 Tax=Setaria digitata TaxID=48799 RepID=A0A915PIY5_9BILA